MVDFRVLIIGKHSIECSKQDDLIELGEICSENARKNKKFNCLLTFMSLTPSQRTGLDKFLKTLFTIKFINGSEYFFLGQSVLNVTVVAIVLASTVMNYDTL